MFAALSNFIYRRAWVVLTAGVLFMVAGGVFGTSVFSRLSDGGFEDPDSESARAATALEEASGRDSSSLLVLFNSKDGSTVDSPEYRRSVEETLAKVGGRPNVGEVTSYYSTGAPQLLSNDKRSTYAVVELLEEDEVEDLRPLLTSDRLQVRLGGEAAVGHEIGEQVEKDIATAEMLTFPILAVLLVLVFGSLVAASLPLFMGGLAILGAFLVLRVATEFSEQSIFSVNLITMLGLGLAVDYSLFIVSRFREELTRRNGDVGAALRKTMQTAGRTVVFSGLTVAISLLGLLLFPQMFLRSMGLGAASAVLIAMLAAITVLPAVLALLGHRVNSLSVRSIFRLGRTAATGVAPTTGERHGFWYRMSHLVMRRPVTFLLLTVGLLIWVGLPFLRVNFSNPDARSLPKESEARIVSETLAQDFPRNETAPIRVVVHTPGDPLAPESLSKLYDYTRQIAALPGVRRVDSLVTLDPRLDKPAYVNLYSEANRTQDPRVAGAVERFVQGKMTTVSVLYDTDPQSAAAQGLVKEIRALAPPAGMNAMVGGASAELVDFLRSLGRTAPVAFGLIVGVIFVLLFLMLGSIVVPLKAVLLNILSLSASFGALVWIFQDGHLAGLLDFTPLGSVDGTQPVLMFAIAFGLSMDYEVFLLSRIKEQWDRTGDMTASVALGVQRTGRIITSAALLLFVVIGAFATGEIIFIKQIGVGLGLAILIDATIVRMLLVPATMRLMGRYNWWAPRPLAALYHRLGMGETEHEERSPMASMGA